jgi:hypothetical protein
MPMPVTATAVASASATPAPAETGPERELECTLVPALLAVPLESNDPRLEREEAVPPLESGGVPGEGSCERRRGRKGRSLMAASR